jgi:dTDP-4-dehydrorhamnose 3,5-epimerase
VVERHGELVLDEPQARGCQLDAQEPIVPDRARAGAPVARRSAASDALGYVLVVAATLSLCLLARTSARRAHGLLALLRPLADEVLLAADRDDPAILERCAGLADRRFSVEPAPLHRHLGWLLHECRGDWVLFFEDDEVPSQAFLHGLRPLLDERGPSQIAFPRRSSFGDGGHFVDARPADLHPRLLRNVPGLWRFPGRPHEPVEVLGERRCMEPAIYHVPAGAGADVGVPQDAPLARTLAVDRALIDAVAAGRVPDPAPRRAGPAPIEAVELAERDRFSANRPAHAETRAGGLALDRARERVAAGAWMLVSVHVHNAGGERWAAGEGAGPAVRVGARWRDDAGRELAPQRVVLPESIAAGATAWCPLSVRAPSRPGSYELELQLVHERRFGEPARLRVRVAAPAAVAEAPPLRTAEHAAAWRPERRATGIEGAHVLALESAIDSRGQLTEVCRHLWLDDAAVPEQWNLVVSGPGALRGMHWHERHLDYLTPVAGALFVGLVDLRRGSPTEGAHAMLGLAAARPEVLVIPEGVAHGMFTPRSSSLLYALTRYWNDDDEFGVRWDDPALGLPWPAQTAYATVSERDRVLPLLAEVARRPEWSGAQRAVR